MKRYPECASLLPGYGIYDIYALSRVGADSCDHSQYTKMNRNSQTTSTKCQYHETPSKAK